MLNRTWSWTIPVRQVLKKISPELNPTLRKGAWAAIALLVTLICFAVLFRAPPVEEGSDLPSADAPEGSREALSPNERPGTQGSTAPPRDLDTSRGLWRKAIQGRRDPRKKLDATDEVEIPLSQDQQKTIEQLEAIGYLDGTEPPADARGVTTYDPEAAFRGVNFFVSGHTTGAVLMDMKGEVLHEWSYAFQRAWPNREIRARFDHWRRAYLFENGDVIAIYEGSGVIKIDKDSNLIWANPVRAHHDLEVMPNGDIYLLTRKAHIQPEFDPAKPILEDFITLLDANGKERESLSVLESLETSDFDDVRSTYRERRGDLFHTNTIRVLDGRFQDRAEWLARGNVLTSMRLLHLVAIIDPEQARAVKIWRGFRAQHDPKILDNGNMLIFDNDGGTNGSRVVEIDPMSEEVIWEYQGTAQHPFYSRYCGTAQRLPNGNTLITESGHGRAFEVTADKEIVWEFISPYRAGDSQEYVASLLEVVRLPAEFRTSWAKADAVE